VRIFDSHARIGAPDLLAEAPELIARASRCSSLRYRTHSMGPGWFPFKWKSNRDLGEGAVIESKVAATLERMRAKH
jgi:hypothetical protein